jgi:hypothetical protein
MGLKLTTRDASIQETLSTIAFDKDRRMGSGRRSSTTLAFSGRTRCRSLRRISLLHRESLQRQPGFHEGIDLREKPYTLFRVKIDAGPVLLK